MGKNKIYKSNGFCIRNETPAEATRTMEEMMGYIEVKNFQDN